MVFVQVWSQFLQITVGPGQWKWNSFQISCLDLKPWSQSWGTNNNANCIPEEDRCQFVDDLTFLNIVNLVNIGISSHDTKQQVPNDLPTHGQIVDGSHLKSQEYLDKINLWSKNQEIIVKARNNHDSKLYRQISISHKTPTKVPKYWSCKAAENSWDYFYRQAFLKWKLWQYCKKRWMQECNW